MRRRSLPILPFPLTTFFALAVLPWSLGWAVHVGTRLQPASEGSGVAPLSSRAAEPPATTVSTPVALGLDRYVPPAARGASDPRFAADGPVAPPEHPAPSLEAAAAAARRKILPEEAGRAPERRPAETSRARNGEEDERAWVFPLAGEHALTETFGDPRPGGRRHAGADIMAPKGTPVLAAGAGRIRWLQGDRGRGGVSLEILHDDGRRTRYLHLNNDTPGTDDGRGRGIVEGLRRGDRVEAGQLLGWVGDSGNAEETGSHLHFEILGSDRRPVNPHPVLEGALQRRRLALEGDLPSEKTARRAETTAPAGGSLTPLAP